MDAELEALGRRAMAAGFKLVPGVLECYTATGRRHRLAEGGQAPIDGQTTWVPDFSDPATLGCLLEQVRAQLGRADVIMWGNGWYCVEMGSQTWDDDNTGSFVEALVRALEAVPA